MSGYFLRGGEVGPKSNLVEELFCLSLDIFSKEGGRVAKSPIFVRHFTA